MISQESLIIQFSSQINNIWKLNSIEKKNRFSYEIHKF